MQITAAVLQFCQFSVGLASSVSSTSDPLGPRRLMGRGQPFEKGGRHATSHNTSNSSSLYDRFFRRNDGGPVSSSLGKPSSFPTRCRRETRVAQGASLDPSRVSTVRAVLRIGRLIMLGHDYFFLILLMFGLYLIFQFHSMGGHLRRH